MFFMPLLPILLPLLPSWPSASSVVYRPSSAGGRPTESEPFYFVQKICKEKHGEGTDIHYHVGALAGASEFKI